jgi:hypothetical protein
MASLAEISKILNQNLDTKLVATAEIVDDVQCTFLHNIKADIVASRSR